jgi:membrane protein implicated in regulation of membrane protease activity
MSKLIPDVQIGTLGGTLIWLALVVTIVVALFTTGLGPVAITAAVLLVFAFVAYFVISRIVFRLKRGTR